MTQSAIVTKLKGLFARGIHSEGDALYLMVETRKLLEQRQEKKQYAYLTFHCDWALHSQLAGTMAQQILAQFDAANIHLKKGIELHELPGLLRKEIDRISKMSNFEQEFETFLETNGLPSLASTRQDHDGWGHFLHLYSQIVEDCPLVIKPGNASATIESVTLQLELAKKVEHDEVFFKVSWIIRDKNGKTGEIFVINSFCVNPQGRHR